MGRVGVFASPDEAREFKQLLLQLRAAGYALQGGQKRPPVIEAESDIVVFNASGEAIPPCAVMQCTFAQKGVIEVTKPVDRYGEKGPYLINGPNAIEPDKNGIAYSYGKVLVHTDSNTGDDRDSIRRPYERFSPIEDEWYAEKNPAGNILMLGHSPIREHPYSDQWIGILSEYPQVIHAKTPGTGIAAGTQSVDGVVNLGKADDCNLLEIEEASTGSYRTKYAGINIRLFNAFRTAIGASTYVIASRNELGLWVVVAEECL